MSSGLDPAQLRPLSVGEIFDRAVTVYVRNFVTFAIISAFLVIPLSVANYFITAGDSGALAQFLKQLRHPTQATPPSINFGPWFAIFIAVSFFVTPFMYVAMARAIARVYEGESPDWRSAYAGALSRAGSIIAMAFAQILILMSAAFAGFVAVGFAFGASIVLVRFIPVLGVAAVVVAIAFFLAYVIALMLCYLAVALAFEAIGIEQLPFGPAIGSGFARVFNRAEFGKAILVCLAFIAVEIALAVVLGVINGVLSIVLRQAAVETLVQALLSIVTTGFIGVLVAVYYFDVRIRREGLDVQLAVDRLPANP